MHKIGANIMTTKLSIIELFPDVVEDMRFTTRQQRIIEAMIEREAATSWHWHGVKALDFWIPEFDAGSIRSGLKQLEDRGVLTKAQEVNPVEWQLNDILAWQPANLGGRKRATG